MATKTLEKIVTNLSNEVMQLRSFVISIAIQDPEGKYKTEFVKKIKKASVEQPTNTYNGKGSLMEILKNKN